MSDAEMKDMLPVEFGALVERWSAEQERLNYRAALVTAAIYNTIRDPKKKPKPFMPEDFIGKQSRQKEAKTPEEMLQTVKALNAALGGD